MEGLTEPFETENEGKIPGSKQGQYQRSGVLWHSESLNKKVHIYMQEKAFMKGSANLTTFSFCQTTAV